MKKLNIGRNIPFSAADGGIKFLWRTKIKQ